jgi:hypothetical protein
VQILSLVHPKDLVPFIVPLSLFFGLSRDFNLTGCDSAFIIGIIQCKFIIRVVTYVYLPVDPTLDQKGRKTDHGKNCIMINFAASILHRILLG